MKQTEILIDPFTKEVGWNYTGDKQSKSKRWTYPPMRNNLYEPLKKRDI